MKDRIYGIYGIGGFAREVMPVLKDTLNKVTNTKTFFISEDKDELLNDDINGSQLISFEHYVNLDQQDKLITISISNNKIRKNISQSIEKTNLKFHTIHSSTSTIMDDVAIGEGSIICPYVTITSNVVIGKHFQANLYSYVAHDCKIGNFVTFAPCLKCNGNVIIEDNVYIGTGAIIKQGKANNPLVIGENSVVGAGSFVTKNVDPNTTVVGNPARVLTKANLK